MFVGQLIPSTKFGIIKLEINQKLKFGRSQKENNYVIDEKLISGVHFEISIISKDIIEIEDKSSNGIVINQNKLGKGKKKILKNGDKIFLIEKECIIILFFFI